MTHKDMQLLRAKVGKYELGKTETSNDPDAISALRLSKEVGVSQNRSHVGCGTHVPSYRW